MSTKAFLPCGGGSKLILETGTENQIFILRTPATNKFFHQILKSCHFGVKKNHSSPIWICMAHIWSPTYSMGNYNFPRSTNKIQFFDEISTSGKKLLI